MKKFKKTIGALCLSGALISLASSIAYANVEYNYELPIWGTKYTDYERKPDYDTVGYNYADYVGWSDTIHCWIRNTGGEQLSSTATYSSAQTVKIYYSKRAANDYYGHQVNMAIKTGPRVFHEINVRGEFSAS